MIFFKQTYGESNLHFVKAFLPEINKNQIKTFISFYLYEMSGNDRKKTRHRLVEDHRHCSGPLFSQWDGLYSRMGLAYSK